MIDLAVVELAHVRRFAGIASAENTIEPATDKARVVWERSSRAPIAQKLALGIIVVLCYAYFV